MADASGVQKVYDIGLDGKGYLVAWEMFTPFAPERSSEAYRKVGREMDVPRQDFSHDMAENKLDKLFRSAQRSFYNGGGQRRLDNPQVSDDEMYLRAKNIDAFNERGALTMSHAISQELAGVGSGSQPTGRCSASEAYLYWAIPDSGTPTNTIVKSINNWGDAGTTRALDANWTAGMTCLGMTNDGANLYVAGSGGIWKGALSTQSTTLARWTTTSLKDIAFVKERILGHTTSGSLAQIYEIDPETGTESQVGGDYPAGFTINASGGVARIFAEVGGYAVWVASAGSDGYLYTWDGQSSPVKAARFPGFQAWGVISYAEQVLYVIGRDPAGAPHGDRWALIRCEISASGQATTDILQIVDNDVIPVAAVQNTEILFPAKLLDDDYAGLDTDDGVVSDEAATVASCNVITGGLNLAKHWGLTDTSTPSAPTTDGPLWGDTGFTQPDVCVFRNALVLVGQNGEVRAEQTTYPPEGQLLSSCIDFNVNDEKMFVLGEVGADPVPTGSTIVFEYTDEDPDVETPTFGSVVTVTAGQRSGRARLATNGVKAEFVFYRLTLTGGSSSPVVRKAAIAANYGIKPPYEHFVAIKAFSGMRLRNEAPWPVDRTPDNIKAELESLHDAQTIVDFQEPAFGERDARASVKVQVAAFQARLIRLDGVGGILIELHLTEVPD